MSDPTATQHDLQRMREQAELYESQGLHKHALGLYRDILRKVPDHRAAQTKIVQLQFVQKMAAETGSTPSSPDDLSPRQIMDLGIAYMEMGLHSEALLEFRKALKGAPVLRVELMRHIANCLVQLEKYDEAARVVEQLMADQGLSVQEKGVIIAELAGTYVRAGLVAEAYDLLTALTDEQKAHIPEYDRLMEELGAASQIIEQLEVHVEDQGAGEGGRAHGTSGQNAVTEFPEAPLISSDIVDRQEELDASIPLNTVVAYSLDSKTWHNGTSLKIAADWALIRAGTPLEPGDSIVLRIYLPTDSDDEPVWIVTRVIHSRQQGDSSDFALVKLQFVSFLPGGEATLKEFIDRVVQDPSILESEPSTADPSSALPGDGPTPASYLGQTTPTYDVSSKTIEQAVADSGDDLPPPSTKDVEVFRALEEEALKAMETMTLPQAPEDTVLLDGEPDDEATVVIDEVEEEDLQEDDSGLGEFLPGDGAVTRSAVRFACNCGEVHVVPSSRIGHKGKCSKCGKEMTVPMVDTKQDSMNDKVVGRVIGGCLVLHKIGGGGMGGVFRAHHQLLDIPVAVKILYAHLAEKDPVFIKRFFREARATAKLQHPNIVGVMNVGYEDGFHYIIMPYITGGSAATMLAKAGRFPLEKVLDIAIQIAGALTVAEENNILHRDIKPANILFTEKGAAKLADLGLAKTYLDSGEDSGITQTGIACGTPLYFSPEQAKGAQDLDIRSDIYSLGITLYHLLQGSPPFRGESAYVIFQKHVHEELPPFDLDDSSVPEPVFLLIKKMTAKKREERFASAKELSDVLTTLKKELVLGHKPSGKKGLLERLGIRRAS